jgi:hypothetical protein
MARAQLATGTLFALLAGLMWGLVFVAPLLLPDYPAALQSFARYLAFGLIALPLAWLDWRRIRELSRADWMLMPHDPLCPADRKPPANMFRVRTESGLEDLTAGERLSAPRASVV